MKLLCNVWNLSTTFYTTAKKPLLILSNPNIVKSEETSLSISAWLKIKFHIAFCKCCRNFGKQTKAMDKVLQHHFHEDVSGPETKAPNGLKDRIKENLQKM